MAEALFADMVRTRGKAMDIASAGTAALVGYPSPPEAITLMGERGLDIKRHRAQQVTGQLARSYELILTMERAHKYYMEANWPMLKGRVHMLLAEDDRDVDDPYQGSRSIYEASLAQIEQGIEQWSKKLF